MIIKNIRVYLNFLSKHKLYTAINLFGLSISLMFVILISAYSIQELSIDSFQTKADRIYILGNEKNMGTAYRLAERIQERYPEIDKTCPIAFFKDESVKVHDVRYSADILFADTTFFELFSFPLLEGDPNKVLMSRNNALISEAFARKVFGDRNPLGQSITVTSELTVTVDGVMKDIKNSTLPYCDLLVRMDNVKYLNSSLDSETFDNAGGSSMFILAKEGADLQLKAQDMTTYFKEIFWIYKDGICNTVTFIPLRDAYFTEITSYHLRQGEFKFVLILMGIGFLILIFAIINYINLTVAQTGFRAKEMAIRRLLGSSQKNIISRLITESTFLCLISFTLGLLFAFLLGPYAELLVGEKMDLIVLFSPLSITILILTIILIGIISGLLPAFIISRTKALDVVRGSFQKKTKMVFSKFFIIFQNTITMILIAVSLVMYVQVNHLISAPLGYNTEDVIDIPNSFENKEQLYEFINEVKLLACVNDVGIGRGTPYDMGNNWTQQYEGRSISFQILSGDSAYFNVLDFQRIRDNHLADTSRIFLTEQVFREMGIQENMPTFQFNNSSTPIAGIIKDVRMFNITRPYDPVLVRVDRDVKYPGNILVETGGDRDIAFQQISNVYKQVTGLDFSGEYIDQRVASSFSSQTRTAKIVSIFGIISVIISFLGLLAMSTYFIQQRFKEIAIRKVHGSSNSEILTKLVGIFLGYVFIAFIIAVPVIWYILSAWLATFSYRIGLSPLFFIVTGVFCIAVSFITVFWQSRKAANTNPVDIIKRD